MKTFMIILKVLAALAAVAGVVYLAATYGDKIVAWARKLLNRNKVCYFDDMEEDFSDELDEEAVEF